MATDNNPLGPYGAPPSGGNTTTLSPLGVPTGYRAPIQMGATTLAGDSPMIGMFDQLAPGAKHETLYGTTPNDSQYVSGDQWKVPLSDPESIPQLQQLLVQAGLLNPKSVRFGTWDIASANAYSTVLGFANAYGLNANQALQALVSNPKAGSVSAGPTIAFTNPADVETGFQNVSQNMTGQEMPTGDFTSFYHSQEAAQAHKTGQNYTQAPSVQGAATQYLIDNDPSQVQAYGTASRMQELYSMLGIRG